MKDNQILVIGYGCEFSKGVTGGLINHYGKAHVITCGVPDHAHLDQIVRKNRVTQIYLLAAMPPVNAEKNAGDAWKLNVQGLLSVLEIARKHRLDRIFWPSSVAVFGRNAAKYNCPQQPGAEPDTVDGISKRTGEYWCAHYFEKYGVDVRSLRLPGLIAAETSPSGGIADYASEIFHRALTNRRYTCYLEEDRCLPMIYLPDAVRATLELMAAPREAIKTRSSYNVSAMSFAPCDLAAAIKRYIPDFKIRYEPDYRNTLAGGWPASIADRQAREDWGWLPSFDLYGMTEAMFRRLNAEASINNFQQILLADYPDFHTDSQLCI